MKKTVWAIIGVLTAGRQHLLFLPQKSTKDEIFLKKTNRKVTGFVGRHYIMGTSGNPGWVPRGSLEKTANSL
jgi:hypothetical protein